MDLVGCLVFAALLAVAVELGRLASAVRALGLPPEAEEEAGGGRDAR